MNTPAQQPLEYAGFWIRLWASIVDSILVAVIIAPIASALYDVETATLPMGDVTGLLFETLRPQGTMDFLLSWVFPAIAVVLFWIYRAATPGKMLVRAKIVDAQTGAKPSTAQCIGRYLGYYVSIFTLMLGFLWIAFDPRKQGFHDKLAGTVVVRTPKRTFTPTQG